MQKRRATVDHGRHKQNKSELSEAIQTHHSHQTTTFSPGSLLSPTCWGYTCFCKTSVFDCRFSRINYEFHNHLNNQFRSPAHSDPSKLHQVPIASTDIPDLTRNADCTPIPSIFFTVLFDQNKFLLRQTQIILDFQRLASLLFFPGITNFCGWKFGFLLLIKICEPLMTPQKLDIPIMKTGVFASRQALNSGPSGSYTSMLYFPFPVTLL